MNLLSLSLFSFSFGSHSRKHFLLNLRILNWNQDILKKYLKYIKKNLQVSHLAISQNVYIHMEKENKNHFLKIFSPNITTHQKLCVYAFFFVLIIYFK